MLFVLIGMGNRHYIRSIRNNVSRMRVALVHGDFEGIQKAKGNVDKVSSGKLSYHNLMMDIDSLKNNLLGTRIINKDTKQIIKANSGSLCEPCNRVSDVAIDEIVSRIQTLKDVSEKNGVRFLYCVAPSKELYEQLPSNVTDYAKDNYDRFLARLEASGIPTVIFAGILEEKAIAGPQAFYYTDHHWRGISGFWASVAICKELSSRYHFEYQEQYLDLSNYNVNWYPNWFLGARGKRVGRFFTWRGAEDFELITPIFETNMTEEQPFKHELREGKFEETVLFMNNMKKDYYDLSPYETYSGGNFRLQIMKNNLNPAGKKIVLVRDSFACVVAPFLALQTSELHVCDIRDFEHYVGDKLNLDEYMQRIKPDYLIVLYHDVVDLKEAHGEYDFF